MKHKKLLYLLVVACATIILRGGHAQAATINVVAGNDAIVSDGNCAFSEAIQNINDQAQTNADCTAGDGSNDTVQLPTGTITLTADAPDITVDIIIAGTGKSNSIINGGDLYRPIHKLTPNTIDLAVHDLTIQHSTSQISSGNLGYGGAINGELMNLSLVNVRLTENFTSSTNDGGALYVNGDESVSITNCEFDHNNSASDRGAAYITNNGQTDVTITGSSFNDNTASQGIGGVSVEGYNTAIMDTDFFDNQAIAGYGGLIAFGQNDLTISGVNIYGNQSDQVGGGLLSGVYTDIDKLAVFNNTAGSILGGLQFSNDPGGPSDAYLHVKNSTIYNNTAVMLGGLGITYGEVTDITFQNVSIVGNTGSTANVAPAGIAVFSVWGDTDPVVTFQNVLIAQNSVNGIPNNCGLLDPGIVPNSYLPHSSGHNLSDDATCTTFTQTGDLNSTNPHLGSFVQDGNTWVYTLLANSPAIDGGATIGGITDDQRSTARPQNNAFDIGAYESTLIPTSNGGGSGSGGGSGNSSGGASQGDTATKTGTLGVTGQKVASGLFVTTFLVSATLFLLNKRKTHSQGYRAR